MKEWKNGNKWNTEVELANSVIQFLKKLEYTTYPEIESIDIVASKQDIDSPKELKIIGVECKKTFNLKVLEQAYKRKNLVDEIYIAGPSCKNIWFIRTIAKNLGIGVIIANKKWSYITNNYTETHVEIVDNAVNSPRKQYYVDKLLCPQSENYTDAGSPGGNRWTDFKQTSHLLVEYVKANPGCSLDDAVKNIKHHYRTTISAKRNLKNYIGGVIGEIRIEKKKLYPS